MSPSRTTRTTTKKRKSRKNDCETAAMNQKIKRTPLLNFVPTLVVYLVIHYTPDIFKDCQDPTLCFLTIHARYFSIFFFFFLWLLVDVYVIVWVGKY